MNNTFIKSLLNFYGINEEEYSRLQENFTLDSFMNGACFKNIDNVASIVKEEISNGGKILIYGDYDCDGIMGVSILKKCFNYLNYDVDFYVPNRYLDNYGINVIHAKEYVSKGYTMVITVDNGITAFEPLEILHSNNIKTIIIDHHTLGDHLPFAQGIVHPVVSEVHGPTSSGAFCAFMFSRAMLGYYDKYLSTLAAISIISDLMPLKAYNRNLLRVVFENYIDGEFLPISLLADHSQLDEGVVGMKIAPRINSIGRLVEDTSINSIINFFISDDESDILSYFNYILDINEKRKCESKEAVENAVLNESDEAIVIVSQAKEGVIGLVASSLVSKYQKPTIVFTKDSTGSIYKGSARSVEGINIVEVFNKLKKYTISAGGHALAGGCSIKIEDYENFKFDFIQLVKNKEIHLTQKTIINININDISRENYKIVQSFSPFGESWPAPLFELGRVKTDTLNYDRTNSHILTNIGNGTKIVGFHFPKNEYIHFNYINLIGLLDLNYYHGNVTTQFVIKEIYPSKI